MTIRRRVIALLREQTSPLTAAEICRALNVPDGVSDFVGIELSSLSGELKRMYDASLLYRVDSWGPRGGYGYTLTMKAHLR